ncbi:hypothetical protein ACVRZH_09370 [Streptococcus fryi]
MSRTPPKLKTTHNCESPFSRFILVSATRLALTSRISIGFSFGVRHPLGPYVQDYYQIDHEPTTHL